MSNVSSPVIYTLEKTQHVSVGPMQPAIKAAGFRFSNLAVKGDYSPFTGLRQQGTALWQFDIVFFIDI
jgi:hypothetical protein